MFIDYYAWREEHGAAGVQADMVRCRACSMSKVQWLQFNNKS